ncbi:hypothetical protein TREES_T100000638 [Tupaia chinensis]|uniref:Uncharacterized protein n=1 Tax=Tupaia chinensis TaxID=246437 RepID=L9KP50_TUPCH|nr:hypothetical protein TREES_T100000638 [Tupaia chinensis]
MAVATPGRHTPRPEDSLHHDDCEEGPCPAPAHAAPSALMALSAARGWARAPITLRAAGLRRQDPGALARPRPHGALAQARWAERDFSERVALGAWSSEEGQSTRSLAANSWTLSAGVSQSCRADFRWVPGSDLGTFDRSP